MGFFWASTHLGATPAVGPPFAQMRAAGSINAAIDPVEPFAKVQIDQAIGGPRISVDGGDVLPVAQVDGLTDEIRADNLEDLLPDARSFNAYGDTPLGPMSIEPLRTSVLDGAITLQTLVWEGASRAGPRSETCRFLPIEQPHYI